MKQTVTVNEGKYTVVIDNGKLTVSRNKREGYYAGYYSWHQIFECKTGHKRWSHFSMVEDYPKVGRYK